jgi:tRNA (guanine37-N1)-methyltransferase
MGFSSKAMTFQTQIITLYPEMFPGPLGISLAGRALAEGKWSCTPIQLRDFATDKHRTVDDTPAGGGAGMVLRADVLARAVDFACAQPADKGTARPEPVEGLLSSSTVSRENNSASTRSARTGSQALPILALTPRGKPITQSRIRSLAAGSGVTLICGRFEGFDERLFDAYPQIEQVSVGDIVLSGGEPAALMILDACIRLLPGVMGAPDSGADESFENGLLEYPHYTRPAEWEGRMIPQVLRSGDHAKVEAWRKAQSEADTRLRRPDLWERHVGTRVQPASGARQKNKD